MPNKSPSSKRKILTATILSTLLISALTATLLIGNVTANPTLPPSPPPERITIKVQSPVRDKVYNATEIPLQFYFEIPDGGYRSKDFSVVSVKYWLDEKRVGKHIGEDLPKPYSTVLTGLSDGEYSIRVWIKVYVFYQYMSGYSDTVYFTVDTRPPSIRVLTSQETFETSDVPVNFTVNEPDSWVGYSIDGNNAVTATEWLGVDKYRLVLNGLLAGAHTLTVYAEDAAGNRGASEPFNFTVTQQTSSETEQTQPETEQTEPFPTSPLVASSIVASAAVISFGLIAYFLRRSGKRRVA